MSVSNITGNKMRTFLTILGIVIGVTAVITLITVVQGVTDEMTSQFAEMGTGKITVTAGGTPLKKGLTEQDLQTLSAIDNVAGVSPTVSIKMSAQRGEAWDEDVSIEGKNDVYFRENDGLITHGRPINALDVEQTNYVCLIDSKLQEKFFYAEDPIGKTINLGGTPHIIIGVLSSSSERDLVEQALGIDNNGKAIVPYTAAMKTGGIRNVTQLEIYAEDTSRMSGTIDDVERTLQAAFNYKDDSYQVINMQSLLDTMNSLTSMMTIMLASIASISLLVGGIGIMNMMLVSVSERTTEIGLRKALGARPKQIQLQFLLESFMLSLLSGIIGAILGVALSVFLSGLIGAPFKLNTFAIVLGVGFSAAVGILFGWAPAKRASALNPIDALRSV